MNEWPENLNSLDLNWSLIGTANRVIENSIFGLALLTVIGFAQATELPTILVTQMADWVDFSGWFADGVIGGFDAAGANVGAW